MNKVLHGDCLELMMDLPHKSIDMILCDLPYGITKNNWDCILPIERLWLAYNRLIKDRGVICLTASQPFASALIVSNYKMFKHEWIWQKNKGSNFANTVREPFKEHESVLVFSKGGWTYNKQMQERSQSGKQRVKYDFNAVTKTENYNTFNSINKNQGNLRVPSSVQKFNTEVGIHPTQKPVALFEYLIRTYTNEGDVVLDNCAGSGTTAIACINTGRKYICMEKEDKYFNSINERILRHIA